METVQLDTLFENNSYERVVVLSPHLDDAVLSCFGLLDQIRGQVSGLVITICCGNPAPAPSRGRVQIFRNNPDPDAYGTPRERRREDVAAMSALDCDFVHLGFEDGIYRRSPTSGDYIYRTSREKFVRPRIEDTGHIEELFLVLRRLCQNMGRLLLVAPLAIGYHVDHSITAHTALRLENQDVDLLFYEDFPYVLDPKYGGGIEDDPQRAMSRLDRQPARRFAAPFCPDAKAQLIEFYESQVPALFVDQKDLRSALDQRRFHEQPAEFYWITEPRRSDAE